MKTLTVRLILILLVSACAAKAGAADSALTRYVNLFLGTKPAPTGVQGFTFDTGDVFPGATFPMGTVQFSPDTPSQIPGGYWFPDKSINSFSLTHYSGRGIIYEGDIGFMPVAGEMNGSSNFSFASYTAGFAHDNEAASPGYYKVKLDNGLMAELTVGPHAGILRATFPAGTTRGSILVNAGNSVRGTKNGQINIVHGNELTGFAESTISDGKSYRVYFSIVFDQPITAAGTWDGPVLNPGATVANGAKSGAFATFNTISSKVVCATSGISYISVANARLNRVTERREGNFDKTRHAAGAQWNRTLNAILITDAHAASNNLACFYTALYHAMIHPNIFDDVNGEYIGFDNVVHKSKPGHHHYTHIDAWGSYQTGTPLLALLFPSLASDVAQSLVDDAAQNGGSVVRWAQQNGDSKGNNGDCGSTTIANAYAFGATNFDVVPALAYMEANASGSNQYRDHGDRHFGWDPARQIYAKLNCGRKNNTPYYWIGNEENFPTPWLYLYAGAPCKSQKVLRDIQTSLFSNDASGLPGNDDAGATSSWYVFSALGLYPVVPGVGGFGLGSPLFASATVKIGPSHVLRIGGAHAAPANPYVQSLQVNGKPSSSLWLPMETIWRNRTTTMNFNLDSKPNPAWANAANDAPPSFDAH